MSYYDDDDDDGTLEEIKKLQEARKKKISLYDDNDGEGYKAKNSDKYDSSIPTTNSKKSSKKRSYEDEYDRLQRESIKKEFDSYSAPSHILDTLPNVDDDDYDPLKKYRAPTVAEQESEYRSRWRKRDLSPPRTYDPFTGKGEVKGRSFKEIMMETQLAREEKEIMMKIEKKKKEEQELEKQKKRTEEYENKKKLKSSKNQYDDDDKYNNNNSSSSNSSNKSNKSNNNISNSNRGDVTPTYPVSTSKSKWYFKVFKNGELIEDSRDIIQDQVLSFGRDPSKNRIVLEHPSCSSTHASITLAPNARRPILLDLKSTNQTFLNGKEIKALQPEDLYDGDRIQFGASTREYIIYRRK